MRAASQRWIPFAAPRWSHFAPPLTACSCKSKRLLALPLFQRLECRLNKGAADGAALTLVICVLMVAADL